MLVSDQSYSNYSNLYTTEKGSVDRSSVVSSKTEQLYTDTNKQTESELATVASSDTKKTGSENSHLSSQSEDKVTLSETAKKITGEALSKEEQKKLDALQDRDRVVHQHEQAHLSAAGELAKGAASFTYQKGPDGQSYAIGGEVQIDTSQGRTPEETLQKAEKIRAAALAPAEPSGQDRQVASQATQMASAARAEIATEKAGEKEGKDEREEESEEQNMDDKVIEGGDTEQTQSPEAINVQNNQPDIDNSKGNVATSQNTVTDIYANTASNRNTVVTDNRFTDRVQRNIDNLVNPNASSQVIDLIA